MKKVQTLQLSLALTFFFLPLSAEVDLRNPPDYIDFEDIPMGNVITTIGLDIKIRAFKEPLDIFPNPLLPALPIVFDSANPGEIERQKYIGSPNESFGGPGVGEGGAMGSPYANDKARGKIMVISSNEDIMRPDANLYGGVISITFRIPTNIDSFGIIMALYRTNVEVVTDDGKRHFVEFYGKHYNSYWLVPIKIPNVVQLVYRPQSISGITHINFKPEKDKCPVSKVLDFASLKAGSMVSSLPDGITVWTTKIGSEERRPAVVLDTIKPIDPDFGAPHNSVGGQGWGTEGRLGMPYENIQRQGNALIVSGDKISATPTAFRGGGTIGLLFTQGPVYIASIGLLNNVKGAFIRARTTYQDETFYEEYRTNVGGRNSFQEVFLWAYNARELTIQFDGPGAVTFVKLGTCTK